MVSLVRGHRDLIVYQKSFTAGKRIFELSKSFPREEMYSLTDQVRRSSRSVSANIAEAWRKRRYEKSFCNALSTSEGEAAETQVWIDYAAAHGYLDNETADAATDYYEQIICMLVAMQSQSNQWCQFSEKAQAKHSTKLKETEVAYHFANEPIHIDQEALLNPPPNV
ncbi:four helix bundle protein [Neorhodopirellula pilleata]|uniref:Four helix bundle protein n=1 Tax=Neorhodopirellula pilleata TaxID=2714738 RepID=A0A5C6A0U3_9BACT|nr:four helix bundle protein [Neorhodopirellula pilleata]TWT92163.1 hypothetical protein Pla100_46990 [Neorhodopirellula pilleata]